MKVITSIKTAEQQSAQSNRMYKKYQQIKTQKKTYLFLDDSGRGRGTIELISVCDAGISTLLLDHLHKEILQAEVRMVYKGKIIGFL